MQVKHKRPQHLPTITRLLGLSLVTHRLDTAVALVDNPKVRDLLSPQTLLELLSWSNKKPWQKEFLYFLLAKIDFTTENNYLSCFTDEILQTMVKRHSSLAVLLKDSEDSLSVFSTFNNPSLKLATAKSLFNLSAIQNRLNQQNLLTIIDWVQPYPWAIQFLKKCHQSK